MSNKPVERFQSQEQLDEYIEYWKEVLGLDTWSIVGTVVDKENMPIDDSAGVNEFNISMKQSIIYLLNPDEYEDDTIDIYVGEKILVHELLHLVYTYVTRENSYEDKIVDLLEHQLIEDMAKTLIRVKYGLERDFFNRKGYRNPSSIFNRQDR